MKVLIGCEESQAVCIAFREKGHEAYSCDILPCSGGHPEWHLQMDVFEAIKLKDWDILIAFPPCTRLTVTANKWYKPEFSERFPNIHNERKQAIEFFMLIANAQISKIAIENPVGIMSTEWRKPNQIIQPYHFGHRESKKTCLWLKGLPLLKATNVVDPVSYYAAGKKYSPTHYFTKRSLNHLDMLPPSKERAKLRSKTFPGIAKAMAEQWGTNINL